MAFGSSQHARPIEGAVATLGVSDRVDFLRKTYGLLGVSLVAFAVLAGGMMKFATATSWGFSRWALTGRWNWLLVILAFMFVGWIAQRLAMAQTSRGLQYFGLGLGVAAEAFILQPLLWVVMIRFGNPAALFAGGVATPVLSSTGASLILQATFITLAIFIGLTITVFVTKKDFSFMRGALMIGSFAVLGIIIASAIFGFHLGAIFCGAVILLLAGYILYQTSLVMSYFPPTGYVAAALMLFATIATLFWYVLQLLMSLRSD
jgi:FtsH-binding integral membrane protein